MIDLQSEVLFPVRQPNSFGCDYHGSTVYRWATRGARSKVTNKLVKLEMVFVGKAPHTSKEAWLRFLSRLNGHNPRGAK